MTKLWMLARLLIFTVFTQSSGIAYKLIGTPPETIKHKEFGTNTGVLCSPDSTSDAIDLKWYGPNEYIPTASEPHLIKLRDQMPREDDDSFSRIYTEPSGSNLKLFINQIEAKDTGRYNCTGRVNNIMSHWSFELQAYVGLTVVAEPEQILVFGENSKIHCIAQSQPPPETSWYFKGKYIQTRASSKYELASDGLIVYNVQFADEGLYECFGIEGSIKGTSLRRPINVGVYTRPVMAQQPRNSTGTRFRDASIICNATSVPAPDYKWFTGTADSRGEEVNALNTGDRFRPSATNGDLSIVNVHLEDEKWYWCEASNKAGKVTGKAYFAVQMIPVFTDHVNLNKTQTKEGNVVEMFCQCEAKPNPKMYFQRQGYPQRYINGHQPEDNRIYVYEKSSPAKEENQKIIPQEVVIRINATNPNDTANYTCISENSAGRNETTMHIIIQHAPHYSLMTEALSTQCIWEDHPRNITVLLSGYPQPAVSWARGDGKKISPDQTAFKTYFEPYWENGRRDEWMANLLINWEVTKGGIQGAHDPVGKYFVTGSNNEGAVDYTVNVVKADLPGRVRSMNVTARYAQSIILAAEPPVEDNCIQAIAFEIVYSRHATNDVKQTALFPLDEKDSMRIYGLLASVSYTVLVYARNERGRGAFPRSKIIATREPTAPDTVEVTSKQKSLSPVGHQVVWAAPANNGEPIKQYIISWRKVGETSWTSREISTSSGWYSITDLQPNTNYELRVQARNRKGVSAAKDPPDTFYTPLGSGGNPAANQGQLPLEIHYIITIAVIGVLIVLVALDMICFCSMDCGVLACICGNVGKKPPRDQGDVLSLDGGGENTSLTDDVEPAEKVPLPPLSMTSSAYDETATHGQDNRMYNKYGSERSVGRGGMSTFSSPEKSQSHEYVNTAKLSNRPSKPAHHEPVTSTYNTGSRPVPQPRVPSQGLGDTQSQQTGRWDAPAPSHDRYGYALQTRQAPEPYTPSSRAAPSNGRPYTSRYRPQPGRSEMETNMGSGNTADYPQQHTGSKPTMI